jgi:hypothetical protein
MNAAAAMSTARRRVVPRMSISLPGAGRHR